MSSGFASCGRRWRIWWDSSFGVIKTGCDCRHIPVFNRAATLETMLKKSIASALLVVMVAWAEIALAPMLAMHAGHVHPARENAANQMAAHHGAGHPCCPGLGKAAENTTPPGFAATNQPCPDEHRCCFRQGPQNVPAPPNAGDKLSRDVVPAVMAELSQDRDVTSQASTSAVSVLSPPPDLFGMILRV